MSFIGNAPNVALDFEMYEAKMNEDVKDEGEFTAALRLLNRVGSEYSGIIDIVKYDALACNSVFIKEGQKPGIDAIVGVKKTTNISLLYLLFNASNIFQLFKLKRLRNNIKIQKELLRLLRKGLYTIKRKQEIICNSA